MVTELQPLSTNRIICSDEPWLSAEDTLLAVQKTGGQLKHIYVYANRNDSFGVADLATAKHMIKRALSSLADVGMRSVAFIHIPISRDGERGTIDSDRESAAAMIAAIRAWDHEHSGRLDEVYLVDRTDDFRKLLEATDKLSK